MLIYFFVNGGFDPFIQLSVGRSQDDIVDNQLQLKFLDTNQHVSPVVNQMDVLAHISDGEGVDGPTEIPDLNIPLDEPDGLDVNAALTNKESK